MPTGPITRPITGPDARPVARRATGPEQATVPTLSPVELSGCDVDQIVGFASAMRRFELAALDLADISHRPGGILITIRHSKTDQDDAGQVVGVAHGQHTTTDPVAALAA